MTLRARIKSKLFHSLLATLGPFTLHLVIFREGQRGQDLGEGGHEARHAAIAIAAVDAAQSPKLLGDA